MRRPFAILAATLAAFALLAPPAQAGSHRGDHQRLRAASIGAGAASTAAYFALNDWHWKWDSARAGVTQLGAGVLTTIGCAALSPMVATVLLNRPLTQREAGVLVGSCVIPVIGGWLVNAAYDAHPDWDPAYRPPHPPRHWKTRRHHRR